MDDKLINANSLGEEVSPGLIRRILKQAMNMADSFPITIHDDNSKFIGGIFCVKQNLLNDNILNSISNTLYEYIIQYRGIMIIDIISNNNDEFESKYDDNDPIDEFIKSFK